jgi:hypothetical protein
MPYTDPDAIVLAHSAVARSDLGGDVIVVDTHAEARPLLPRDAVWP